MFVDEDLRLTRFTPEATPLFNLRSGDEGRSIEDFAHRLDYPSLFADLRQHAGARRRLTEREVRSRDGRWWLARIQPYPGRSPGSSRAR
ncbi:MAG: PAS domain-containing protein [Comamonadaceae bacterium]|nr:PAS domain-containing protein [Comamonadaceae bacterium]